MTGCDACPNRVGCIWLGCFNMDGFYTRRKAEKMAAADRQARREEAEQWHRDFP